jgi:SAM-dependent methyltransferase
MRKDLIADLFEKEETYWWNLNKREMVSCLLKSLGYLKEGQENATAADIGCGAGYTAKVFESRYRMVGIDVSMEALQLCRGRGLKHLCQMDTNRFSLPFKSDTFDLVLALDVIEHLEDDTEALKECHRILRSEGHLVVTVPAFMALWSPWDEALGHRRRYTAQDLATTANKAGFHLDRLSYMFFFVFPLAVVVRRVKQAIHGDPARYSSDFIPIPKLLNQLLLRVGRVEQWILTRLQWNLPVGLSVISIMTKRKTSDDTKHQ